jgi:hypothetical protein
MRQFNETPVTVNKKTVERARGSSYTMCIQCSTEPGEIVKI